ncbi:hypothetical protein Ancab_032142 [Ancistrocladus abbreviatus]
MAEDLGDGEFWLPSQFLTDDDILMDFAGNGNKPSQDKEGFHGLGFDVSGFGSFGLNSGLSSPCGESATGSTETESDEEEYLAGLTREMARSTLDDYSANSKGWILSGSPQSTLCAVSVGCDCNQGSSRGSPSGPVSPPAVAALKEINQRDAALDLLYAAAGEVAKIWMRSEQQGTGFFDSSNRAIQKPTTHGSHLPLKTTTNSSYSTPNCSALYSQQLQASHLNLLNQQQQQQLKKQMNQQLKGVWGQVKTSGQFQTPTAASHAIGEQDRTTVNGVATRSNRPQPQSESLSLSAFPPPQHPNQHQNQPQVVGMGRRTVFPGTPAGAGPKRECAGTGVFLPRRIGSQTDSRKKAGASSTTAFIPAKVVQALNNMNTQSQHPPRLHGNFASDPDGAMRFRTTTGGPPSHRRSSGPRSRAANSHEIKLPQEWSY